MKWQFIIPFLKNKYVITGFVFLLYLFFFARHDWFTLSKLSSEKKELQKEIQQYKDEIPEMKATIESLKTDSLALEKFAREEFGMKKANEDVFIIREE